MAMMVVQEAILDKSEPSKIRTIAAIFQDQGVFEKLQINTPEDFFDAFAVIVDGNAVHALDVEVSQHQRVVVLPRIVGG